MLSLGTCVLTGIWGCHWNFVYFHTGDWCCHWLLLFSLGPGTVTATCCASTQRTDAVCGNSCCLLDLVLSLELSARPHWGLVMPLGTSVRNRTWGCHWNLEYIHTRALCCQWRRVLTRRPDVVIEILGTGDVIGDWCSHWDLVLSLGLCRLPFWGLVLSQGWCCHWNLVRSHWGQVLSLQTGVISGTWSCHLNLVYLHRRLVWSQGTGAITGEWCCHKGRGYGTGNLLIDEPQYKSQDLACFVYVYLAHLSPYQSNQLSVVLLDPCKSLQCHSSIGYIPIVSFMYTLKFQVLWI